MQTNLEKRLADANEALARINRHVEVTTEAADEKRTATQDARVKAERDEVDAVLEGRRPNSGLTKALAAAEVALAEAERKLEVANLARTRAFGERDAAQSAIAQNRHADALAAIAGPVAELNTLMDRGGVLSRSIGQALAGSGSADWGRDIFPPANPKDLYAGMTLRQEKFIVFCALSRMGGAN